MQYYCTEIIPVHDVPTSQKPFCMSNLHFPSYSLYSSFLALPAIITESNLLCSSLHLQFSYSLLLHKITKASYFSLPI